MVFRRAAGIAVMVVAIQLFVGLSAETASALTTVTAPDGGNRIFIGMVRPPGYGVPVAAACIQTGSGTTGYWVILGTASGLNDDYSVYADTSVNAIYSSDHVFFTTDPSAWPTYSYCGSPPYGGTALSSWAPLLYNGYYLNAFGRGSIDTMVQGSISGATSLFGEGDTDYLSNATQLAYFTYGGNGNDVIASMGFGAGSEFVAGQAGDDCLSDWSTVAPRFGLFDCGPGTDRWNLGGTGNASPSASCEGAEDETCRPPM